MHIVARSGLLQEDLTGCDLSVVMHITELSSIYRFLTHFVPGKSNLTSTPSPVSGFPVVPVAVGVTAVAAAVIVVVVVVVVVCCCRRRNDNGGQLDTPRAFS